MNFLRYSSAAVLVVVISLFSATSHATDGRIFVSHDEWTLTDFSEDAGTPQFVRNLANWFAPNRPGKFLIYSTNWGFLDFRFRLTLMLAGHTYTLSTDVPFTLETLKQYDAVFVGGDAVPHQVLIDYVRFGGNVYLAGGTGQGSAAEEAQRWNTFLETFGLRFEPYWNQDITGICGLKPLARQHETLRGVSQLHSCNGNTVRVVNPNNRQTALLDSANNEGFLAIYDGTILQQPDDDHDGIANDTDNCPCTANTDQRDQNADGFGDACRDPSANIATHADIGRCAVIQSGVTIDNFAVIGANSVVGKNTQIGYFAKLGSNVQIGDSAQIYNYVTIGDNSTVGASTLLEWYVKIGANTHVGDNGLFRSHVTVGDRTEIGHHVTIEWQTDAGPDSAKVGNNVSIGDHSMLYANVSVGDNTTLGKNVVAYHGVELGQNVILEDNVVLYGNVSVDNNTRIGAGSAVYWNTVIGKNVTVAPNTVIPANTVIADGP